VPHARTHLNLEQPERLVAADVKYHLQHNVSVVCGCLAFHSGLPVSGGFAKQMKARVKFRCAPRRPDRLLKDGGGRDARETEVFQRHDGRRGGHPTH
jgi:hypothetical protein